MSTLSHFRTEDIPDFFHTERQPNTERLRRHLLHCLQRILVYDLDRQTRLCEDERASWTPDSRYIPSSIRHNTHFGRES